MAVIEQNLGNYEGDSFVHNCHIIPKDASEPIFVIDHGNVYARLDGYAIVPLEYFEDLKRRRRRWWHAFTTSGA